MRHIQSAHPRRRAAAAVWAILVLGILSVLLGTITAQVLMNRQVLHRNHDRTQSLWLARSGIEVAAAHLLTNPRDYKGETLKPMADAQVRIQVVVDKVNSNFFVITSEAHYPTNDPAPIVQSITRKFRLVPAKDQTQLESVAE